MAQCICCRISGRVQGVWFRASTRDQAQRLGIRGSAINCPDGRVEVIACGEPDALQQLQRWLHQGPPGARVDEVICTPMIDPGVDGFHTG
jgi:acylphosphatase